MFANTQTRTGSPAFIVDDQTFARVVSINEDGSITIELTCLLSRLFAIKNSAAIIDAWINVDKRPQPVVFRPRVVTAVGTQLVSNVINLGQQSKSVRINAQAQATVAHASVLSMLDNTRLTSLARASTSGNTDAISTFVRVFVRAADVKRSGDVIPLLQRYLVNNDESDVVVRNTTSIATSYDGAQVRDFTSFERSSLLQRDRIMGLVSHATSPASLDVRGCKVNSAEDAFAGVRSYYRPISTFLESLIDALTLPAVNVERTIIDLQDNEYVLRRDVQFDDMAPYTLTSTVSNPLEKNALVDGAQRQYHVTFNVSPANDGKVIETLTKRLDMPSLVGTFNTPRTAPNTQVACVNDSRNRIDIESRDDVSSSAIVLKRVLSRVEPLTVNNGFSVLSNDAKLTSGVASVFDAPSKSAVVIYRTIPVGKSKTIGSKFCDKIVRPAGRRFNKFASVVACTTETGVTVEIRGMSHDVAAVSVQRRDLTLHEHEWTIIEDAQIVQQQHRTNGVLFAYDQDLKEYHTYEYSALLTFRDGLVDVFGSAIVEYVKYVSGVDTKVENLVVTGGDNPDVSFSITTTLGDTSLDGVVTMLEAQGMSKFFDIDVMKERDKLQSLIAHNVVRVNLTRGVREDFGVVTAKDFVDSALRKQSAVSVVDAGDAYRYEVSALLRAPETMFDELTKNVQDDTTGKQFSYKPSKFSHPVTLKFGNIVTSPVVKAHYSKSPMLFGRVGNVEYVDVTFSKSTVSLSNVTAMMHGHKTISLLWTVNGDTSVIDHFVIVCTVNGVRRIIGTTHAVGGKQCKFFHDVTSSDYGYTRFSVIPVLNDFTQLAEVVSNTVVVK